MRRLVALDLPAGKPFVAALQRCFSEGDAALPIDQRLPPPARAQLFAALRPGVVRDGDGGETVLADGLAVEDGDALVLPTSGTTGTPRGVVLTHDALGASASATSAFLNVDPARDRWLCCLPVAHIGGVSVITRALLTDTPLEVLAQFSPKEVLETVASTGVTLTSLVPTALFRLGTNGAAAFRAILLGGSAIPDQRPLNTVATYGMTETASGVVYEGRGLDGVEFRVDETGEIAVRGPMLLRCYRDGTDPKDEHGWFATGDGGQIAPDGTLSIFGRIGDVIVSGGEKIWPAAVEAVLIEHRGVAEVAVAGAFDPEWGERVVAYVVPEYPGDVPTLQELRDAVRAVLGAVFAPRELVIVDALPKTALGKVQRHALGVRHREHAS